MGTLRKDLLYGARLLARRATLVDPMVVLRSE